MSLRAVLFTTATVGWVFATLGVVYHDAMARDVGLLVTTAAVALVVLAGDAAATTNLLPRREPRATAQPRAEPPTRSSPPAEPAAGQPPAPSPAPAVSGGAKRAAWSAPTTTWEASENLAPAAPVQEPVAVAPVQNGHGNGHHAAHDLAATAGPAGGGDPGTTRGMCSKCRTPITVSKRRPLRVTCPVCNHSKVLT